MFDLEKAIRAWRRGYEYRRALTREDLKELECHLRDQIDLLRAEGLTEETAFAQAVRDVGDYATTEDEYRKVFWEKAHHHGHLRRELIWRGAMLTNYFKIALRNFKRHKGYACINVMGLAVGLACCLLILLFIHDEWRHDRFHTQGDQIYRVVTSLRPVSGEGGSPPMAMSSHFVADHLRQDYPEVENLVRLQKWSPQLLHDGQYYEQDAFLFADPAFFEVFSFPLLEGNPATALHDPHTMVLTESMQKHYFGEERALGQTLVLNDSLTFTVTGIAADPPAYSHIQFEALVSRATVEALRPPQPFDWVNFSNNYTYVLLREGTDPSAFGAKIQDLPMQHFGETLERVGIVSTIGIEPFRSIFLYSETGAPLGPRGNLTAIYVFGAIALFVLLIACINFMNLSTARSTERAREVGIRKLVGSQHSTLVVQFLSESILTVFVALVGALVLVAFALPGFNELAGKELAFRTLLGPTALLLMLCFVGGVGVLAGSYPALILSRFRPATVLKGPFKTSRHGARLRQSLVVFQFAISIVLIIGTAVVFQQLRYMQNQRLGFDKEQVLVLDIPASELTLRHETIADAFGALASVQAVASSNVVPGQSIGGGVVYPGEQSSKNMKGAQVLSADAGYLETMGIDMVAGRGFSDAITTDAQDAALINEAALAELGYASPDDALGKTVIEASDMRPLTIVGVISDYHHQSLQERIGPMLLRSIPRWYGYLSVRLNTDALSETMQQVEATWNRLFPGHPFTYFFLDEAFDQQYTDEQRLIRIFGTFAGLAILIACLGLFGLASFMTMQRTKEIGMRKVLGASVGSLVLLLTRGIAGLVAIALVIAAPLAYFAMNHWLADFAYHIELSGWIFLIAGLAALLVALGTVSYQAIRAALADPVKSLRYE